MKWKLMVVPDDHPDGLDEKELLETAQAFMALKEAAEKLGFVMRPAVPPKQAEMLMKLGGQRDGKTVEGMLRAARMRAAIIRGKARGEWTPPE